MATLKTAMVVVSIGANIATAAYLISPRASQSERQANETRPSAGVPVAFASNGGVDAAAVRQLLMQQGFSDHETKLVVLGLLNAAALDRAASVPYEYWRADDARSTASRIEAAERRSSAARRPERPWSPFTAGRRKTIRSSRPHSGRYKSGCRS
jgi:hypothetical protein